MTDIPGRLLRQERPIDPVFSPDERLFRAIPRKDLTADGRLLPPAIEFPDFSVNRERYSVPEDENYSHSEVRTYRDGQRSAKEPPKRLRTLFRLMLFPKMVILKEPETPPGVDTPG